RDRIPLVASKLERGRKAQRLHASRRIVVQNGRNTEMTGSSANGVKVLFVDAGVPDGPTTNQRTLPGQVCQQPNPGVRPLPRLQWTGNMPLNSDPGSGSQAVQR